jgi:undecaprenyl-diphosphatase
MSLDRSVQRFFLDHRSAPLTALFKLATHLGSSVVLLPLIAVLGLAIWARRRTLLPLGLLAATYGGALVLETGLKHLIGRARPPAPERLVAATGYAFPSGHATLGTAVWTAVAVLLVWATSGRRWRWAPAAVAVAVILAVDASRLYLGVHWLSDVLAGSLVGGAWAGLVLSAAGAPVRRRGLVGAVTPLAPRGD